MYDEPPYFYYRDGEIEAKEIKGFPKFSQLPKLWRSQLRNEPKPFEFHFHLVFISTATYMSFKHPEAIPLKQSIYKH